LVEIPQLSLRIQIALAFVSIYTIWGSTYLGIRFAIQSIPPFLMAGIRFIIAGGVILSWAAAKGIPPANWANWRGAAIVGGLLLLGGNGGVTWAEQTVPSSLAAVLITTVPIWMVIVELFEKDRKLPTSHVIIGLIVGFAGVVFLVGPTGYAGGSSLNLLGAAVIILAGLSWAIGSVYSKHTPQPKSQLQATGMEMFAGGILLTVAALVTGEWAGFQPSQVSTISLIALVYLTIFGSIITFTAYVWLLNKTTIARVSTYAYVNPIVAVSLGVALAGEQLTLRTLLASAVIVVAVFVIITFKEKHAIAKQS
jgi:drug/metabolite transporter (DMT)-like permease